MCFRKILYSIVFLTSLFASSSYASCALVGSIINFSPDSVQLLVSGSTTGKLEFNQEVAGVNTTKTVNPNGSLGYSQTDGATYISIKRGGFDLLGSTLSE